MKNFILEKNDNETSNFITRNVHLFRKIARKSNL